MRKKVGNWIRVSTDMQVEAESPEVHRIRGQDYAAARGWDIAEEYLLPGLSGKSVFDFPETQRMLADIASGKITGLLSSSILRLSRNTIEVLEMVEIFNQYGANLYVADQDIDISTPSGKLAVTITAAMGQADREGIAARVAASVPIRAKMGRPLGGAAPFGYRWKKREMVVDKKEAPIRKLMYELYLEIRTIKGVANELNKRGFRTRKGNKFLSSSVRRSLTDSTAKGVRIANYTRSRGNGCAWNLKPEEDWVRIPVEPIVEEDIWDECNHLLVETGKRYLRDKTNKGRVHNLFSGVLYCGTCGNGQKLYPRTHEKNYVCQKCLEKIAKKDLEELFIAKTSSYLVDEESVFEALQGQESKLADAQELLEASQTRLRTVEKKITNCFELYHGEAISLPEVKRQMGPLEEEQHSLGVSIKELMQEVELQKVDTSKVAEIISDGQSLAQEWPNFDFTRKRSIIEAMVESIVVTGREVIFNLVYLNSLKFLPDPEKGQNGPIMGVFSLRKRGPQPHGLRLAINKIEL